MEMENEIRIGSSVEVKVGRNLIRATVVAAAATGWRLRTASGGELTRASVVRVIAMPETRNQEETEMNEEEVSPREECIAESLNVEPDVTGKDTGSATASPEQEKVTATPAPAQAEGNTTPEPSQAEGNAQPDGNGTPAPETPRKMSLLKAALEVLGTEGKAMNCKEILDEVVRRGLWERGKGKTPVQTLYGTFCNEIRKSATPRVRRSSEKGKFELA